MAGNARDPISAIARDQSRAHKSARGDQGRPNGRPYRGLADQPIALQHVEGRLNGARYPAPVADDPAMTPLPPTLRVLGVPALHGPDGEPITFRTRKHFALLIYLALEPQTHRREKLGALLWPRATTGEARHSLATGLSVLRARLGRERLETDRDTVRLVPGALEIDLDRLARGDVHATETTPALAVAPLLQEFVVPDAGPWDLWRDALAAKWQPAIRDALLARIDRARRQGNTRAMEVLADALLQLDDLSEDGIRAKMESRAFAGDRLTALQYYESWRVRLADELGAQPSDLVAGMALRLRRRGWERTSGEHIPAVRTDQWKDRHFVGRAREYEVLYEGWEGCQRGTHRHVLLTGESGVGKSTLVERLTTAAGLQGAVACRIQCHEVEKEIPYGAIGALITLLLERPGATAVSPEWLSELSRTVSGVRRKFPHVAPASDATGEMVRIRLTDAFHELVRAIAEEQPLVLVMDDIHLSDDASVAVMHLLLRRLTDERALVICTLRQGDGALAPSARGMLERAEIAQMSVLPLLPLSEAESAELLGHLVPGEIDPPPSTVRRALLRAGGGLPMLLELLVRDWMAHGDRCVALAVDAMTEEPGAVGGAGETYRRLLERLTVGLDPSTRSVLNLAAVLGSQLNEFELYGLVDLTLAQAMAGLSQLAAMRILRDGGQGLEFVNEVMRGEAYLAVPSSVRRVLHSKVADRLIERAAKGEEMLGLAIAWHCMRSSRVQEAGEWLIKGGEEAIARSALAEAEAALESGMRHLPSMVAEQCGALLGEVLLDQERYREAHKLALHLSNDQQDGTLPRIRELLVLATLALGVLPSSQHATTFDALLSLATDSPSESARLRAATLATALAGRSMDGTHLSRLLASLKVMNGDARSASTARWQLLVAQVHYFLRQIPEAEAILSRLLTAPAQDGPALFQFNLQTGLGTCSVARGDYPTAVGFSRRAVALARHAGATGKERAALGNLSVLYFRLGVIEESYAASLSAQKLGILDDASTSTLCCIGTELSCLAIRNDREAFGRALAKAYTFVCGDLSASLSSACRLWIADGLWLIGDHDKALQEALTALQLEPRPMTANLGLATRWAALLSHKYPSHDYADRVASALGHLNAVDALDRLEIATAALSTLSLNAEAVERLRATTESAVALLPPAVGHWMGKFGLASIPLSDYRSTRIQPLDRRFGASSGT
jgi:DNA-binding SARP family transcriptional activator/tetratricopeptide (TPR) repeat protein